MLIAVGALISIRVPEEKAKKFWLVPKIWKYLGEPIRNYKLKHVAYNKVVFSYFSVMGVVNGGTFFTDIVYRVNNGTTLELSFASLDETILAIDAMLTLIAALYIILHKGKIASPQDINGILSVAASQIDEMQELMPVYRDNIDKLHLNDAYKALKKIKDIVSQRKIANHLLMSSINFNMAKCLEYIDGKECLLEYERAYNEMLKANNYNNNIASHYAYRLLLKNKKEECASIAETVLDRDIENLLANVCKLGLADDIEVAYNNIPEYLRCDDKFLSYAFVYLVKNNRNDLFDAENFSYSIPDNLTFQNISIWIFYMTVSMNIMLHHEGLVGRTDHKTELVRNVYDITKRYLELAKGTDVIDTLPDIKIYYIYTKFFIEDKTTEERKNDIEEMKQCRPLETNRIYYVIFLMEMLMTINDETGVVSLLENYKEKGIDKENKCFCWLFLSFRFGKAEYAKNGFEILVNNNISIPNIHSTLYINAVMTFSQDLSTFLEKLEFEDTSVQEVYQATYDYYVKQKCDQKHIEKLAKTCYKGVRFFLAKILADEGQLDKAIGIVKPLVSTNNFSMDTSTYIHLLEKKQDYKSLFFLLKELRHKGFNKIEQFLKLEFNLAIQCSDTQDILEVTEELHRLKPNDIRYLYNYLASLGEKYYYDKVREYVPTIMGYGIINDDSLVKGFTNLLLVIGNTKDAIEFLYTQVLLSKSQALWDFWFQCYSTAPAFYKIVNRSKNTVEIGDYVFYEEDQVIKKDEVYSNSLIDVFVGHGNGDIVEVERLGVLHKAVISDIKSKFFVMQLTCMRRLQENGNSQNIKMFTLDDLKKYTGNILDGLMIASGGIENKKRIDNFETQYAQGKNSFLVNSTISNAFQECFNRMFGNQIIYTITYKAYANNPISKFDMALDLSSLLLLVALTNKFNLKFSKKFIVPEGLHKFIDNSLDHEKVSLQTCIYQESFDNFGLKVNDGESHAMTILKYVRSWMEQNCKYQVADDMLQLNFEGVRGSQDSFFRIEAESLVLTVNNPIAVISEDWGLTMTIARNVKSLNVCAYLYYMGIGEIDSINQYLANIHFAGSMVDENYMFSQYQKKQQNQPNSFDSCLDGLKVNFLLRDKGLKLAMMILSKKIKLPEDHVVVITILSKIIEGLSGEAIPLLEVQVRRLSGSQEFYDCFVEAVKLSRIIIAK